MYKRVTKLKIHPLSAKLISNQKRLFCKLNSKGLNLYPKDNSKLFFLQKLGITSFVRRYLTVELKNEKIFEEAKKEGEKYLSEIDKWIISPDTVEDIISQIMNVSKPVILQFYAE